MSSPEPYPPQQPYPGSVAPPVGPRNGVGTAALIVAVIALLLCWTVIAGIIGGLVAVVLGIAGRARVKHGAADNGAITTAGIALGALAVVVGFAFVPIWTSVVQRAGFGDFVSCIQKAGSDPAAQAQCESSFREKIESEFAPR